MIENPPSNESVEVSLPGWGSKSACAVGQLSLCAMRDPACSRVDLMQLKIKTCKHIFLKIR